MMPKRKKQNGKGLGEPEASRPGGRRAFSLAELLVFVVILAVAFMLVQVDSAGMEQMKLMAAADTLQSDIHYLQQLARTAGPNEVYLFIIQTDPPEAVDAGEMEMWDALACADGGAYVNHGLSILPQSANALTYLYPASLAVVAESVPEDGFERGADGFGACCSRNGCQLRSTDACLSNGGVPLGLDSSCGMCPADSTGACCRVNSDQNYTGVCENGGPADCSAPDVFFMGLSCDTDDPCTACADDSECDDGDACTQDSCEAGACVLIPISCDDYDPCTDDSCETATGCVHAPVDGCESGACCVEGMCMIEVASACGDSDGEFHSGVTCEDIGCSEPEDPLGACCVEGLCYDDIRQSACVHGGWDYQGDDSSCSLIICSSEAPPDPPEDPPPDFPEQEPLGRYYKNLYVPEPPMPDFPDDMFSGLFDDYGDLGELPGAAYALVVVNTLTDVVTPIKIASLDDRYGVSVDYPTATTAAPVAVRRSNGMLAKDITFILSTNTKAMACRVTQSGKVIGQFVQYGDELDADDYPATPESSLLQDLKGAMVAAEGGPFDLVRFLGGRGG